MKKTLKYVLAATLLVGGLSTLSSCAWKNPGEVGVHTYNTYTAISPSNWNELSYQDNNDTQIMSYIGSSFFGYDFKFDNEGEIVPGEYVVTYEAATDLEDVTAEYAGNEAYAVPAKATKNYAYKITLRNDLKWDDGTPIKAEDFVYTMKEQLNPQFKHYRADSFYNSSTVIHGAKDYVFQGDKGWFDATMAYATYDESLDSKLVFSLGSSAEAGTVINTLSNGQNLVGNGTKAPSYFRNWIVKQVGTEKIDAWYVAYVMVSNWLKDLSIDSIVALENKTLAEIKNDPELKATWDAIIGWWQTEPNEELHFFSAEYTFPQKSFDTVGLKATGEYELTVVLDKPLDLLKENGDLSYKAAYNFSGLPLVKKDLFESCKKAPVEGSTLWTSTYNSSLETTASWGPYKLTKFQAGKQYVLERNTEWYGYSDSENEGLYQTDRIVCDTIAKWNTAWLAFQKGNITSIGVDVSIADDYKGSSRAVNTPDDFVGAMQLQSNLEALAENEAEESNIDKEILGYADFRKAISLAVDRAAYNTSCTTSSKPGFGLFNSMHYHDVANGGVYRNTDEAKQVLCNVYGVNVEDFGGDLDAAVASITGYDLAEAKILVERAYQQALTDGKIDADDTVKLAFGTGAITESTQRVHAFLDATLKEMVKGTSLEGRLVTTIEDHQTKWADDFRAGAYEICLGGWSGAAWDPGYFLLAYLSPDYMYSSAWDTSSHELTYTVNGVTIPGVEEGTVVENPTLTMSLMEWYDCLNGMEGCRYDWSEGAVDVEVRLGLIAALEEEILKQYYTVPMSYSYGCSLLSYKVEYITTEYNTFMSYGGIKYMTYNYDDYDWYQYVHENKVDYKA